MDYYFLYNYWASEVTPTLTSVIEIKIPVLADIYYINLFIYSILHTLTIVFPGMHDVKYLPIFKQQLFNFTFTCREKAN